MNKDYLRKILEYTNKECALMDTMITVAARNGMLVTIPLSEYKEWKMIQDSYSEEEVNRQKGLITSLKKKLKCRF